jgi:hypothetical protein
MCKRADEGQTKTARAFLPHKNFEKIVGGLAGIEKKPRNMPEMGETG